MQVKIRYADGVHFVRVGRDGKLDATADRGGLWEIFDFEIFPDGRFALRTLNAHPVPHKYVRAVGGGGGELIADRDVANDHEKFTKVNGIGFELAIRTAGGEFWRAKNAGGSEFDAAATEQRGWEQFSILAVV